jgi:hypothetical protein
VTPVSRRSSAGQPRLAECARERQGQGRQSDLRPQQHDPESFGRVARIFVDPKANEAYIADGYFNKRVAVIDAATGKLKRFWGRLRRATPTAIVDVHRGWPEDASGRHRPSSGLESGR